MSNWNGMCAHCKHFEQGETNSYCSHPKQTNDSLKEYVYHSDGCSLNIKGIAKSRLDYMKQKLSTIK